MSFAIRAESLSKRYYVQHGRPLPAQPTLREEAARVLEAPRRWLTGYTRAAAAQEFWALRDVSFDVHPGETVALVGRNGAGKSTLLKILSKVVVPTSGNARVRGRVGGLLEVASGFHPELTGRENIYLSGILLGMRPREIASKSGVIADFAGLDGFIDEPVKHYSTGMSVRLAFSVAAHLEPDILLLDEVLSVGDGDFQRRSGDKVLEITRQEGRTVLLVGHDLHAMQRLCSRCLVLDGGRLLADGPTAEVLASYRELLTLDPNTPSAPGPAAAS